MIKFYTFLAMIFFTTTSNASALKPLSSVWTAVSSKYNTGIRVYDMTAVDFSRPGVYELLATAVTGEVSKCRIQITTGRIHEIIDCTSTSEAFQGFDPEFAPNRFKNNLKWFSNKIYVENYDHPHREKIAMIEYR
jgi:hypothetical protein